MTGEQPERDFAPVTFLCLNENYEKVYSAAARNGESMTDAWNRAGAFYWQISEAKPGTVITWRDRDGTEHKIKVVR